MHRICRFLTKRINIDFFTCVTSGGIQEELWTFHVKLTQHAYISKQELTLELLLNTRNTLVLTEG